MYIVIEDALRGRNLEMGRRLTTEEYHRFRGLQKQKHLDSMTYGTKNSNEKAKERFRRPPYAGLFSSSSSGGEVR